MKIKNVIDKIKAYHKGEWEGKKIDDATTRDKILYGNSDIECTGIVTTCWATVDVIREAAKLGANLIIAHEALFWNHGDHTDWLIEENNKTFLLKKQLLDETGIVVWRNHDYIHSGIPMKDGSYTDGIFYGLADKLGWVNYITKDICNPLNYEIPEMSANELAQLIVNRFELNGVKVVGDLKTKIKKVQIPFHILGEARDFITDADKNDIDCFMTMELVDFTLAEYIRDTSMLGLNKAIIGVGHFNLEEPGMEYMVNYLSDAIGEKIPCQFVKSGDMYNIVTK